MNLEFLMQQTIEESTQKVYGLYIPKRDLDRMIALKLTLV